MANSPSERNTKRTCETPPSSSSSTNNSFIKLHTQLSSDESLTNTSCCLSVDKLISESMSSPLSLPPPSTSPSLSSLKSYPLFCKSNSSTSTDTGISSSSSSSSFNSQQMFRNPNSIESIAVPSPASSLEQFDFMATPLSVTDDITSDTSILLESTIK
jgi:hypothetical protein